MADAPLARSPFENLCGVERSSNTAGVVVADRQGLGIATVMARRGQRDSLAQRMREHYAIELPGANRRTEMRGISVAAVGPDTWLAAAEPSGNEFATALRANISVLASISDQTDAYAVLRLSGVKVRETLAKLVPIDVHPRAFKPGHVASTVASHMAVTLWRLDDGPDGNDVFEIAMYRSLAGSFWHVLMYCAAEFGLTASAAPSLLTPPPSKTPPCVESER